MPSDCTAKETIITIRIVFSRLGLCKHVVTDNRLPFQSREFQDILQGNGIEFPILSTIS